MCLELSFNGTIQRFGNFEQLNSKFVIKTEQFIDWKMQFNDLMSIRSCSKRQQIVGCILSYDVENKNM